MTACGGCSLPKTPEGVTFQFGLICTLRFRFPKRGEEEEVEEVVPAVQSDQDREVFRPR